jgi:hypothetical protein
MKKGMGGHQSARMRTDEWLTPPDILRHLGPFDLDPCSPINRPWSTAADHFTLLEDGLKQNWFGRIFLNPPYGQQTGRWLNKLAHHGNGIALTFARTETKMFFEHVWNKADAVLFLKGRPHFYTVEGNKARANSGAPVVLIAYGVNNKDLLKKIQLPGKFIDLNP